MGRAVLLLGVFLGLPVSTPAQPIDAELPRGLEVSGPVGVFGVAEEPVARELRRAASEGGHSRVIVASAGTGTIQGTVTDADGGAGLPDVWISLFDDIGEQQWDFYASTDATGNYSLSSVPTGTYFLRAQDDSHDYVDEVYDGVICPGGCDPTLGTPLVINDGTVLTADIDLEMGGSVAGTVIGEDTGLGIEDVLVTIHDAAGIRVSGSGYTDGSGAYSASGLPTGTYNVYASVRYAGSESYVGEVYPDLECPWSCEFDLGTPVAVTAEQTTVGIDFELAPGGILTGTVTDGSTSAGINRASVHLITANGTRAISKSSNSSGDYAISGLPSGTYYAAARSNTYLSQLFEGKPCPSVYSCDVLVGTPLVVVAGSTVGDVDFQLAQGSASIAGRVTDGASGIEGISVSAQDQEGTYHGGSRTDNSGNYQIDGLPEGTYFVTAGASFDSYYPDSTAPDYIPELYNDLVCVTPGFGCDVATGQQIPVADGQAVTGIDFVLGLGGKLSGQVRGASTGAGATWGRVRIFDVNGEPVSVDWGNFYGYYTSRALPAGSYHAVSLNRDTYIEELHDGSRCVGPYEEPCDFPAGNELLVTAGTTVEDIDFELDVGGTVSGTILDQVAAKGINGVWVRIYDDQGRHVVSGSTRYHGGFTSTQGLPTGSYFAKTEDDPIFLDELYDDMPCDVDCDPTMGDSFEVTEALDTPGIDFELLLAPFFEDGFESGDTSAWSNTKP